jgi:hypothetical protein
VTITCRHHASGLECELPPGCESGYAGDPRHFVLNCGGKGFKSSVAVGEIPWGAGQSVLLVANNK